MSATRAGDFAPFSFVSNRAYQLLLLFSRCCPHTCSTLTAKTETPFLQRILEPRQPTVNRRAHRPQSVNTLVPAKPPNTGKNSGKQQFCMARFELCQREVFCGSAPKIKTIAQGVGSTHHTQQLGRRRKISFRLNTCAYVGQGGRNGGAECRRA